MKSLILATQKEILQTKLYNFFPSQNSIIPLSFPPQQLHLSKWGIWNLPEKVHGAVLLYTNIPNPSGFATVRFEKGKEKQAQTASMCIVTKANSGWYKGHQGGLIHMNEYINHKIY